MVVSVTKRWPGYQPNVPQAEFHRLARHPDTTDLLLLGGVGSGKTYGAAQQFLLDVLSAGPRESHIVMAPSYRLLEQGAWETLKQISASAHEKTGIDIIVHENVTKRYLMLANGARVYGYSADKPEQNAACTSAINWYDEAALSGAKSMAGAALLKQRGRSKTARYLRWYYSTTPRGPIGIVDWFRRQVAAGTKGVHIVTMPTLYNVANLAPGYLEGIKATATPSQWRQQVFGELITPPEAVFGAEWDPAQCVVDWHPPPRGAPQPEYRLAVDHGDPNNGSVLLIAHIPESGIDVVIDEWHEDMPAIPMISHVRKQLRAKWRLTPDDIRQVCVDPNPRTARTEWKTAFPGRTLYSFNPRLTERNRTFRVVQSRLLLQDGRRRLFFSRDLLKSPSDRRITQSMALYKWRTIQTAEGPVLLDQTDERQQWSHAVAALRYYCLNNYGKDPSLYTEFAGSYSDEQLAVMGVAA